VNLQFLDQCAPDMEHLSYQVMGEFGIPGRRYFRSDSLDSVRTHQVYAFQLGSVEIDRHLAFRDYMKAHPEAAASYSRQKKHLASQHQNDPSAYMEGKGAFMKEHEARALQWARRRSGRLYLDHADPTSVNTAGVDQADQANAGTTRG